MTEPISTTPSTTPLPLFSRIVGVITSPKATFENIAAAPRPVGVLLVVALVISVASTIPQFTPAGRQATLDMQVKTMERMGMTVTPEMYSEMEVRSQTTMTRAFSIVGAFVFLPIVALFFAAIYWAVFNTAMGGTATFKQVLAIVTHSQVIGALGQLASLPVILMQGTMSMTGPFNLGALAPWLEPESKLAAFLSGISVFGLWGIVVTGIGLGVLYRRSARNIAIALIVIYLLFIFVLSSVVASFMGRAA